jgi:hypothetical protein
MMTRATDRAFCVNLVLEFEQDERLEVAVEERAPIISFSFGLRPELVSRAPQARGCSYRSVLWTPLEQRQPRAQTH